MGAEEQSRWLGISDAGERSEQLDPADKVEKPRFRIGVFAIIERHGYYLLAHRSDIDWWNLPGGGLEYDETLEEGLTREVREEIGSAIEIERLVGVYSKPRKREVVLTFLCHLTPDSAEPGTSDEVSNVAWFLPSEFPTNLLPKHRQRLDDALLAQTQAVTRAQTTSTEEDQRIPKGM
ncbi:MAG: NUDIX hydrolase [Ktedonobacterales bacterium]